MRRLSAALGCSAEYFQGCKDEPTAAARYNCLPGCSNAEPAAQCDAEGFDSDF